MADPELPSWSKEFYSTGLPGSLELENQNAKYKLMAEGSPEQELLRDQLKFMKDYYGPRIVQAHLEKLYRQKGLALPEEQWAAEAEQDYSLTKEQLGNLWFGKNGHFSLVQTSPTEYKELVCNDRGCNLMPVTDKTISKRKLQLQQSLLHDNLCELLERPDPCAGVGKRYGQPYIYCMQQDNLRVFRKLGFFQGVNRDPADPLSLQPGETPRQRLLRDREAQASIQEWLNHFDAAPQEELEAFPGWLRCGVEPQEVRNLTYYRMVQKILPARSREAEDLDHYLNGVYHYRAMATIPEWDLRNQTRYAKQLRQWHFQSAGYPLEEPEQFVTPYAGYGNDVGAGLLSVLGPLGQMLLWALSVLAQSLGSHPRMASDARLPASGYECGFAPFAAISSSSLVVFRQLAVYFVVFEAELIFLYPWSAALLPGSLLGSALGYYGVVPFLVCLVVGFALEIQRDALKL